MDDALSKPVGESELARVLALHLGAGQPAGADAGLDGSRIERLRSLFGGEEAITMLVRIANEVTNQLARLDTSLADGDYGSAASAAHSIRGSAQMVGATSQSAPPAFSFVTPFAPITTNGTGLIVCAVSSVPVARSTFSSALP